MSSHSRPIALAACLKDELRALIGIRGFRRALARLDLPWRLWLIYSQLGVTTFREDG